MKEQKPNSPSDNYTGYLKYSGLAFQMLAVIGLAVWAGIVLDGYLQLWFPAFTVILSLSGVTGVIYLLIKNIPKY